jgi:branched-chain amino acid transport system ATP-binding protein
LISGYLQPDEGEIFLKNESTNGLKPHDICRRGLTRTFQLTKPFSNLSVLENVVIASLNVTDKTEKAIERASEALDFCGLSQKRHLSANRLTIAERKKLELARCLGTGADVLLLDEIMGGLNASETVETIDLVRKIWEKGLTIFIVEHVMKVIIDLTNRVIVLNYGEKIAEGRASEIFRNPNVIKAYLGEEFAGA